MQYEATIIQKHVCRFCKGSFDLRSNLLKHIQQIHTPRSSTRDVRTCPLCGLLCLKIEVYRNHLKHIHGYQDDKSQVFTFKYIADFQSWKKELEKRNYCKFLLHAPLKILPSGDKIHVYHCDSSMPHPKSSKERRQSKSNCPAVICVLEYAKSHEVKVEYWSRHVGHNVPQGDDELEAAISSLETPEIVVMTEEQYEEQYSDNSSFFVTESNDASVSDSYKESPKPKKKLFQDQTQSSAMNSKSFTFKKDQKKKISSFGFSLASVACMKPSVKKAAVNTPNESFHDPTSLLVVNPDNIEVSTAVDTVSSGRKVQVKTVSNTTSNTTTSSAITNIVNLATMSSGASAPATQTAVDNSKLADLANINDGIINGKFILLKSTDDNGKENLILCPVDIPNQAGKASANSLNKAPSLMQSLLPLKDQKGNKLSAKKGVNKYDDLLKRKLEKDLKESAAKRVKLSDSNDGHDDAFESASVDDPEPILLSPISNKNTSITPSVTSTISTTTSIAPASQGSVPGQNFSAYPPGQAFMMTSNNMLIPIPTPPPGQAYFSTNPQISPAPNATVTNSLKMPNTPGMIRPLFTNSPSLQPGQFLLMPQTPGTPLRPLGPFISGPITPGGVVPQIQPFIQGSPMIVASGPPMKPPGTITSLPLMPGVVSTVGPVSSSGSLVVTSSSLVSTSSTPITTSIVSSTSSAQPLLSSIMTKSTGSGRNPIVSAVLPSNLSTDSILKRLAQTTNASSAVILNSGRELQKINFSPGPGAVPKVRNVAPKTTTPISTSISPSIKVEPATKPVPTIPALNLPQLPSKGKFLLESSSGTFMVETLDDQTEELGPSPLKIAETVSLSQPKEKTSITPLSKSVTSIFSNVSISSELKAKSPKKTPGAGVMIQSVLQSKRPMKDDAEIEIMKKVKYYQLEMKYLSSEAECKRLKLELARSRQKEKEGEKKTLKEDIKSENTIDNEDTDTKDIRDNGSVLTGIDELMPCDNDLEDSSQRVASEKKLIDDDKSTDTGDELPNLDDFVREYNSDDARSVDDGETATQGEAKSGVFTKKRAEESLQKLKKHCGDNVPADVYTMIRTSVLRNLYADMKGLSEENKKLNDELQQYKTHEQFVNVVTEKLENL